MQEANSNLPDAVNEDLGDFSPPADFNHGEEAFILWYGHRKQSLK